MYIFAQYFAKNVLILRNQYMSSQLDAAARMQQRACDGHLQNVDLASCQAHNAQRSVAVSWVFGSLLPYLSTAKLSCSEK